MATPLLKALFDLRRITDAREAAVLLRALSYIVYALGVVYFTVVVLVFRWSLGAVDAVNFILLGYAIGSFRSRVAAIVLFITAIMMGGSKLFLSDLTHPFNFSQLVIACAAVFCAFRAAETTMRYHELVRSKVNITNVTLKTFLAFLYGAVIGRLAVLGLSFFLPADEMMRSVEGWPVAELMGWSLAVFLTFKGWLPFTKNRPLCEYDVTLSQLTKISQKEERK